MVWTKFFIFGGKENLHIPQNIFYLFIQVRIQTVKPYNKGCFNIPVVWFYPYSSQLRE